MIDRVKGRGAAEETPIGLVPTQAALNWDGLDLSRAQREALLRVDRAEWAAEVPEIRAFFDRFGTPPPAPGGPVPPPPPGRCAPPPRGKDESRHLGPPGGRGGGAWTRVERRPILRRGG